MTGSFRSMIQHPSLNKLSLVIPCFNEVNSIPFLAAEITELIETIHSQKILSDVEIFVVDDGSTDGSLELARSFPQWKVIQHSQNQGYGAALKTGFAAATGDLLAFIDMDVTYWPMDLIKMIGALKRENLDIVFGRRERGTLNGMPFVRQLGNSFFAQLTRFAFGERLSDVCTGLRLMRADRVKSILLATDEDDLSYSLALTINLLSSGLRLKEIPVRYRERTGQSKLNVARDGLLFLRTLTDKNYAQNLRRRFIAR